MTGAEVLRGFVDRAFRSMRWHVEDLDDGEYFWEPSDVVWGVRERSAATIGWGTERWVCEDTWPPPDPVPNTTIGWRVVHVAAWTDIYRDWTWHDARLALTDLAVPGTAGEAVEWLFRAQEGFATEVAAVEDADLSDERPAHYGGAVPMGALIRGIAFEHIHHGAEIGLLRDLRRGHARLQPYEDD